MTKPRRLNISVSTYDESPPPERTDAIEVGEIIGLWRDEEVRLEKEDLEVIGMRLGLKRSAIIMGDIFSPKRKGSLFAFDR